jgi:hypothetical protein
MKVATKQPSSFAALAMSKSRRFSTISILLMTRILAGLEALS